MNTVVCHSDTPQAHEEYIQVKFKPHLLPRKVLKHLSNFNEDSMSIVKILEHNCDLANSVPQRTRPPLSPEDYTKPRPRIPSVVSGMFSNLR